MNIEIMEERELLDSSGRITKEGWARRPLWRYDRSRIKAPWWRIKEWDYYSILSHDRKFGITLTLSDLGYAGLCAVCFLDFERGHVCQVDTLAVLPMGRTGLGPDSDSGHVAYADPKLALDFEYRPGERVLTFAAPGVRQRGRGRGAFRQRNPDPARGPGERQHRHILGGEPQGLLLQPQDQLHAGGRMVHDREPAVRVRGRPRFRRPGLGPRSLDLP